MYRKNNSSHFLVFIFGISLFWLLSLFIGSNKDLSNEDIALIASIFQTVLIFEIGILLLLSKFINHDNKIMMVVGATIAVANTITIYYLPAMTPMGYSLTLHIVVIFLIFLLYFVALHASRSMPKIIITASLLIPLIPAAQLVSKLDWTGKSPVFSDGAGNPLRAQKHGFNYRPNLYFLSFDAMVSPPIVEKYMDGISLPYMSVLEKYGATRFTNVFSDRVPTWYALPSVLMLGLDPKGQNDAIMTGRQASVLGSILAFNGYSTHFLMYSGYFGHRAGPYLTSYRYLLHYSACSFIDRSIRDYVFFGYCPIRRNTLAWGEVQEVQTSVQPGEYTEFALAALRVLQRRDDRKPLFYMEHVLSPVHAPSSYGGSDAERKAFLSVYSHASQLAADEMDHRLNFILKNDPEALIFIYSDHGAYLSNHLRFIDNPSFYIQDRYGAFGAIINGDRCLPYMTPPEGEHFQTISRLALGILACLGEGWSPFEENPDYGRIKQMEGNIRFEDYLYE